jgi:RNA recognition motif-containing protein
MFGTGIDKMKLYVGNMPFSMDETQLRSLFSQHGEIVSANVIMDRDSGRPRGFAFVEMSDEDAQKAMSALDNHEVEGRNLKVSQAKPRNDGGSRRRY